jgi:hypothetical protein
MAEERIESGVLADAMEDIQDDRSEERSLTVGQLPPLDQPAITSVATTSLGIRGQNAS